MNVSNYNSVVPRNIMRIIEKTGLKYRSVAEKGGYSPQQMSDMLNGRKIIKASDVLRLATALNVSVNDLFSTNEDDQHPA